MIGITKNPKIPQFVHSKYMFLDGNVKNTPEPKRTDPICKVLTVRRYFLFLSSYVENIIDPIIPEMIKQPATIEV